MVEILDATEHARLIADQDHMCAVAGVRKSFLHTSMTEFCGPIEVEWVKNFRRYHAEGVPGLVLEGISKPDTRCQAMAGALMRNYIDARVIPTNTLIDLADARYGMAATVLLIPNLFVTAATKAMPSWRVQILYDLLLNRTTQGKTTVVYVEDLTGLMANYGLPFRDFLDGFMRVTK